MLDKNQRARFVCFIKFKEEEEAYTKSKEIRVSLLEPGLHETVHEPTTIHIVHHVGTLPEVFHVDRTPGDEKLHVTGLFNSSRTSK
jgi:hypothetical protein